MLLGVVAVGAEGGVAGARGGGVVAKALRERAGGGLGVRLAGVVD